MGGDVGSGWRGRGDRGDRGGRWGDCSQRFKTKVL